MGRHSFPDQQIDEVSQAAGQSRERAAFDAASLDRRNLAVTQDARAQTREDRMAKSQSLNDEIKQWEWEKQKTFDAQAAATKIATDKRIIEASQKLFKIDPRHPDAWNQISGLGAEYADVIDKDPRLNAQFNHNATVNNSWLVGQEKLAQEKATADAKKADIDARKAAATANGLVETGITVDGTHYGKDAAPNKTDSIGQLSKDMEAFGGEPADLMGEWTKRADGNLFINKNPNPTKKDGSPAESKPEDFVTMPAPLHAQFKSRMDALTGTASAASTTPAIAPNAADIYEHAREAIKLGADANVVKERLTKMGADPSKL